MIVFGQELQRLPAQVCDGFKGIFDSSITSRNIGVMNLIQQSDWDRKDDM